MSDVATSSRRVAMVDPAAYSPDHDDALCRALAAGGAEVDLVTSPFRFEPWPEARGFTRSEIFPPAGKGPAAGGRERAGRRLLQRATRLAAYPSAWRKLEARFAVRPPDVLHLQWAPLPAIDRHYLRRIVARGIPLVMTVHNVELHGDEPLLSRGQAGLFGLAGGIVVHSRYAADALERRWPGLANRVRIVPPGVEPPATLESRAEARRALELPADAPIVLFAGLIRPYKGVELLVEAFAAVARALPGAWLVIAGRARETEAALRRAIAASPARARIRFESGYLERVRFERHLLAADVVALPYRRATDSAVLGAALAAGRAVVASRCGGLPELLGGRLAAAMQVEPGDSEVLSRALLPLLHDRQLADRLGREAQADVLERRSWRAAAATTLEAYAGLEMATASGATPSIAPLPA